MATIKLQDGKVVLKGGKPSCECCLTCPTTMPSGVDDYVVVTSSQANAIKTGGIQITATMLWQPYTITADFAAPTFPSIIDVPGTVSAAIINRSVFFNANCDAGADSPQGFFGDAATAYIPGILSGAREVLTSFFFQFYLRQISAEWRLGIRFGGTAFVQGQLYFGRITTTFATRNINMGSATVSGTVFGQSTTLTRTFYATSDALELISVTGGQMSSTNLSISLLAP